MDDIAPEYDVVVLGTGRLPRQPTFPLYCSYNGMLEFTWLRLDRVCPVWVSASHRENGLLKRH